MVRSNLGRRAGLAALTAGGVSIIFGAAWGISGAALAQATPEAPGARGTPEPPALEFAFEVRAEVADPLVIAELPEGTRRIVDIVGGTVSGPGVSGRLRPGGADWQLIRREDGFTVVDARYTIETASGSLIYVQNKGIRHAPPEVMQRLNAGETVDQSAIYFRCVPTFETGDPALAWLMRSIFVCTGERYPNGVVIRFFRVP